ISLFIAATKLCPISSATAKSRDVASRASTPISAEETGISAVCSMPRCRIVIANLATSAAQASGCDTSFCSRTCAMPTEPGIGIVHPLTSAVWRLKPLGEIIRRKLMPNLEHVTWRDPTVTPSRLAIPSRLIPSATKSLIFWRASGVNFTRLPLTVGLAFVIVMAAPYGSRPVVIVYIFYVLGPVSGARCDGHHEMVEFRARGATGRRQQREFTGIFASDAVCSLGVDLVAVCLAASAMRKESKKAN